MNKKRVIILILLCVAGQAQAFFCCGEKPPVVAGWFERLVIENEDAPLSEQDAILLQSKRMEEKKRSKEVVIHKKKRSEPTYALIAASPWNYGKTVIRKLVTFAQDTHFLVCANNVLYSSRMDAHGKVQWLTHTVPIVDVTFGSQDEEVITLGLDDRARLITKGAMSRTWKVGKNSSAVSGLKGQQVIISSTNDGLLQVWDSKKGSRKCVIKAHDGAIHGISSDAQGRYFASASADGTIAVYDSGTFKNLITLEDGRKYDALKINDTIYKYPYGNYRFFNTSFDATGNCLVAGSTNKAVYFRDLREGKKAKATYYQGHSDWVTKAKFDPSCETIVISASDDCTFCLWDTRRATRPLLTGKTSSPVQDIVCSFQNINACIGNEIMKWKIQST